VCADFSEVICKFNVNLIALLISLIAIDEEQRRREKSCILESILIMKICCFFVSNCDFFDF